MRLLPNKLVANLPYAVAATVVLDYLSSSRRWKAPPLCAEGSG
ncbi:MAG: hypothetical protein ACLTMP_07845 [Eggerthella lenta]